jgi:hypothetical protein
MQSKETEYQVMAHYWFNSHKKSEGREYFLEQEVCVFTEDR